MSTKVPVQGVLRAVDEAPVAMTVASLPEGTVRLINETALAIIGYPRSEIVGKRLRDFTEHVDATDIGMMALANGTLSSYHATRRLKRNDGRSMDVSVWVRAVGDAPARYAVSIIVPLAERESAGSVVARLFGPDATDLAVGTIDEASRIRDVSTNAGDMLGWDPSALVGTRMLDLVHPEDAERCAASLRHAVDRGEDVMTAARMRDSDGDWTPIRCVIFRGPHLEADSLAFALAAPAGDAAAFETSTRAMELERHLMRIGAELHSSGLLHAVPQAPAGPEESHAPGDLSERQQEIVERLLRGERVPGIAAEMHLSPATVRNHLTRVFEKYGVHSQAEMIALLRQKPADAADG